ncbi:hypothetical protein DL93DRAFT_2159211 [Clavulina sp. PMI_390]|nr:hypothetical protein DL93DRAFT_2159211 [Clavulina sp. PMI_390]
MEDVHDFFASDDGTPYVRLPGARQLPTRTNEGKPSPTQRLGFLARAKSHESFVSRGSTSTKGTVAPQYGVINFSLADLCKYIDIHRSLQIAAIITSECYFEAAGPVLHRFLLLELRREGRKIIWLRLDRRRGENVSLIKFLSTSGVTKANDQAMLSSEKAILIGQAEKENSQVFANPPNLGSFARVLRIINEEIALYRLWPENCWFFCSLLQQHLGGAETGWFMNGSLKYAKLATEIRARIFTRLQEREQGEMPHPQQMHSSTPLDRPVPIRHPVGDGSPFAVEILSSSDRERSSGVDRVLQIRPQLSYNGPPLSLPPNSANRNTDSGSGYPKKAEDSLITQIKDTFSAYTGATISSLNPPIQTPTTSVKLHSSITPAEIQTSEYIPAIGTLMGIRQANPTAAPVADPALSAFQDFRTGGSGIQSPTGRDAVLIGNVLPQVLEDRVPRGPDSPAPPPQPLMFLENSTRPQPSPDVSRDEDVASSVSVDGDSISQKVASHLQSEATSPDLTLPLVPRREGQTLQGSASLTCGDIPQQDCYFHLNPALVKRLKDLRSGGTLKNEQNKQIDLAMGLASEPFRLDTSLADIGVPGDRLRDCIDTISNFLRHMPQLGDVDTLFLEEKIRLGRALSTEQPLSAQGVLASLLSLLSHKMLVHRSEEGCTLSEEAITIYREAYKFSPSRTRSELSWELIQYATHLGYQDRHQDAQNAAAEAVKLARLVHGFNQSEGVELLAGALLVQAKLLSCRSRFEEAKSVQEDANTFSKILYDGNHEKYRSRLQQSLQQYAAILLELGNLELWTQTQDSLEQLSLF